MTKKQSNNNPLGPLHSGSIARSQDTPKAEKGFAANLGSRGEVVIMTGHAEKPEKKGKP